MLLPSRHSCIIFDYSCTADIKLRPFFIPRPASSAPGAHCPGPNPLIVTGTDARDFLVHDVRISTNTGWIGSQGWVHLLVASSTYAPAKAVCRNEFHTWTDGQSSPHNFVGDQLQEVSVAGQALPCPALTALSKRNGLQSYHLRCVRACVRARAQCVVVCVHVCCVRVRASACAGVCVCMRVRVCVCVRTYVRSSMVSGNKGWRGSSVSIER